MWYTFSKFNYSKANEREKALLSVMVEEAYFPGAPPFLHCEMSFKFTLGVLEIVQRPAVKW
jgi:hypothetical protein